MKTTAHGAYFRAAFASAVLGAAAGGAHAAPGCYRDPRTDAFTCYDQDHVTESKGIRYSDVFMGGPKGITRTSYQWAVNCSTGVIHLKDAQGVSFSGGMRDATELSKRMYDWICAESIKKRK